LKWLQSDNDDEDKYADDMDMPGQKFETKNRITVRNLRIREDTAKVGVLFCLFVVVVFFCRNLTLFVPLYFS
jgi:hypothetical protein